MRSILRKFTRVLSVVFLLSFCATSASANEYYWVGGSGNWSDFSHHWATTSGGSSFYLQVPQSGDNVHFDAGSGFTTVSKTVTVDVLNASANDMDWTGAANSPTFTTPSTVNSLGLSGSLTLIPAMTYSYIGSLNFIANTTGKTINTAGRAINGIVNFNGVGGGWTLQTAFTGTSGVNLLAGTFNTNDLPVTAGSFTSSGSLTRSLLLGTNIFTITTNGSPGWSVSGTGFTLTAGTSNIVLNSNSSLAPSFTGGNVAYYDVTWTGTTATNTSFGILSGGTGYHNISFAAVGGISSAGSISSLTFLKSASMSGNNTITNLILTGGATYTLGAGNTQTVTNISATGTCSGLITLLSSTAGTQATISQASGAANFSYVSFKDIKSAGAAVFTANNSVNAGNTAGITINSLASRNLYWIGNGGNWDDGNHWSLTSGGPAAGCAPSSVDNVFFNANSFTAAAQTVTVNVGSAAINHMDWTGVTNTPTFTCTSPNLLNVAGSVTLASAMNLNYTGTINFISTTTGQTISAFGKQFGTVNFSGIGGGWVLQSEMKASGVMTLNNGSLNTNNQPVSANQFASNGTATRSLVLGSTVFTLTGQGQAWALNATGLTFNSGTSTLLITYSGTASAYIVPGNGLTFYDVNWTGTITGTGLSYINGGFTNTYHNISFASTGQLLTSSSTFNSVTFSKAGTLGNGTGNTISSLVLTPGYTYIFPSTATTTLGSLTASGNCNALVELQSTSVGSAATISRTAASGALVLDYVSLKDITKGGSATFTANNSVNAGNNTGITINSLTSRNLYWIGNGGNWDDPNHWSLTSGGAPAGCAPNLLDNVFFDANSFTLSGQTVTLNVYNAAANNMNWTGVTNTPTFSCPAANSLDIAGSFILSASMNLGYSGTLNFIATTPGQTISTFGLPLSGAVNLTGIGGGWTLQTEFKQAFGAVFTFNSGTFNTNNLPVTFYQFVSSSGLARSLSLGSSVVTMLYQTGGGWLINSSTNMTLNAGTSTIQFTDVNFPGFTGGNFAYYDVKWTATVATSSIPSLSGGTSFHNVSFFGYGSISTNASFNDVTFLKNGTIAGTSTYANLTFTPGYTYAVTGTQTITNTWNATGTGSLPILLNGTGTISKASGVVCNDYLRVTNMTATGGATFNVGPNGQDISGNTGWNFAPNVVTISVSLPAGQRCLNSSGATTFTAIPVNGGTATFEWFVNGVSVQNGASTSYTSSSLAVGNTVKVVMTSTFPCGTPIISNSNILTLVASPVVAPVTGLNTVCVASTIPLSSVTSGGAWTSTNASVASVSGSGVVTGVGAGTATISYAVTNGNSCVTTVTSAVTVNALPTVAAIAGTLSVCAGSTSQLSNATGGGVWSSDNSSVATVDAGGLVTAVAAGTATISYSVTNANNCVTVVTKTFTVNALPLVATITGTTEICKNGTSQLSNTASGGLWTSSNTTVATITAGGLVSALTPGTTTISYKVTNANNCITTVTTVVTVNALPIVAAITGAANLCSGSTTQLSNVTAGGVWSSLSATVATVNVSGLVTGVSGGTASIVYTVTNANACVAASSLTVTVSAVPAVTISVTGSLTFCTGSSVTLTSSSAAGNAMTFNGSNHVESVNTALPAGNSARTVEAWVKTTGSGAIVNWGTVTSNNRFGMLSAGGKLYFVGENNDQIGTINIGDGLWHHVAVTFDGTTVRLYVDGTLDVSASKPTLNTSGQTLRIGRRSVGDAQTEYLAGSIDEVRIWNFAKTQAQIQASKNLEVAGNSTGLVAYYKYNENNGTTTADASNNHVTATLNNSPAFAASGATINYTNYLWTPGNATTQSITPTTSGNYVVTVTNAEGCTPSSAAAAVTATPLPTLSGITGNLSVCSGSTTTLTAASADASPVFRWYTASTNGTLLFTGAAYTTTALTATGTYYVSVTNGSNCTSATRTPVTVTVPPFSEANATAVDPTTFCAGGNVVLSAATYALQFNGSNTVTVANGYAATDDLTYEATITPTAFSAGDFNVVVNHDNFNAGAIHFQFANGQLQFAVSGNVPQDQYASFSFTANTTYKIAAVYSKAGKYVRFFVNGVFVNQQAYTTAVTIGSYGYRIGSWNGNNRNFQGTIDNIRIWNLQRSTAQILDAVNNTPIPAGTTGLVRYYRFDEGTGSATADDAGNGAGVLVNSPSWIANSPAGATYLWSPGASTTQNITANTSGSYTVQVTNASGCTTVSDPIVITVNPLPTVSAVTGVLTVCSGNATTLTAASAATSPVFKWYNAPTNGTLLFTGAAYSTGALINTTTYYVDVTNNNNCTSSTRTAVTVTVNPLPTVAAISGTANVCIGSTTQLSDATGSGVWSSGNSSVASINASGLVTGVASGTALISYTVTNANNCVAVAILTVTVNPLPTVAAITGTLTVCAGSTTQLNDVTASGVWSSSNTAVANINAAGLVSGVANGATVIKYTVTNVNSCVASAAATVTVNALPVVTITPSSSVVCAGVSVTLAANSGGGNAIHVNGTDSYIDLGAGVILPQTFTQEAWIYSGSGNDGQFHGFLGYQPANTNQRPPSLWISDGNSIHGGFGTGSGFYYYITGNVIAQNTWNHIAQTYDGTTLKVYVNGVQITTLPTNLQPPVNSVPFATGVRNIGRVDNYFKGDIDEVRLWNVTRTAAQIKYDMNRSVAPDTTGLVGYYRFNENAGSATTADATAGSRTGTLTNGPTFVTSSAPVGATITWSPSAGLNTTTGAIAIATPTTTTTYIATATDPVTGCVSTASSVVTVNPLPTASVSGGVNVCQNAASPTVTFTGANGTAPYTFTYTINSGAQQTVVSSGNTATVSAPTGTVGTFTYALVSVKDASATTCSNTASGSAAVTVRLIPVISSVTGTLAICSGASTTLTAASSNATSPTFRWYNAASGGTLLFTGAAYATGALTATTNYYAEVSDIPVGCTSTARTPVTVTVNALPAATISAGGPTTFCTGGSVILTASAGTSYSWSNGSNAQSITVSATGNYSVTVTNANNCSATSAATGVTVNTLPTATISAGGVTTFCSGGSVILTASAGSSYAWSNGANTQSITVNASGSYSVTVTNANNCSATSAATGVTVNPLPNITAGSNSPVTAYGTLNLSASGANTYAWSGPNSYNATGAAPSLTNVAGSNAGTYFVTGTNTATGCTNTATVNAVVNFIAATGLDFDGVNDHVSFPAPQVANLNTFTLEAWVKPTLKSGTIYSEGLSSSLNPMFSLIHTPNGNNGFEIVLRNTSNVGLVVGTTNGNLVMNQWQHVVFVRTSATTAQLYINGVMTDNFTFADPGAISVNVANLGVRQRSNKEYFFTGSMDEVRIWNRALCQAEIQSNKDCEMNPAGQTGLLSLYHFNQGLAGGDNTPVAAAAPGAPTINTVTAGNGSALINFTAPASDGGAPISTYTVTAQPGGLTAIDAGSPILVAGLNNGTAYTFTVVANNANGSSVASAPSATVTPQGVVGAPTAVTATLSGNNSAIVSFTAPSDNGGSAVLSYTVTSSPAGLTATGSSSPITVSSLPTGVSYTFTVVAINGAGAGASSAASAPLVVPGLPGAPTITNVGSGNTTLTVSFTPPASNGGSPITSYRATATAGASNIAATGTASPITISGLVNGTNYVVTVTATTSYGTSSPSGESAPISPKGPPGAPTGLIASAVPTFADRANVVFVAPAGNGGSAVTSYTVISTPGSRTATGTGSPLIVTGLTTGTSYTFRATATNVIGTSAQSNSSAPFVPTGVPGQPRNVNASAVSSTAATVTFLAPTSNGGLTITGYRVTSSPGGITGTASSAPITVNGLTAGVTYSFTVEAINSKGAGAASTASNSVTLPGGAGSGTTIFLVWNPSLGQYLNARSGYIFNPANGSETDPVDGSPKVFPYPAGQVPATIQTSQDKTFVSYDSNAGRFYTYRFSYISPAEYLEFDRNGIPFAYVESPVWIVTSDNKIVNILDGVSDASTGIKCDPLTGEPITGIPEAYTPVGTPNSWLLPAAAPTVSINKNKTQDLSLTSLFAFASNTIAINAVNDKPSYLTGPYEYSNTSAADHIELSGNITTEYYGNSSFLDITDVAPAGSATATATLIDATGNNNGTLNNFALTGNTSNWTNGMASGTCTTFVPPTTPVTGVPVVCVGSTTALSNATAGGTWSSSNPAIATVSATGVVTGMSAGSAIISYTNLCSGISTATVTVNALPTASVSSANVLCLGAANGSITITANNGTAPYQYSKDGGANYQTGNSFTGLMPGTYNIIVKSATGCVSASQQVIITTVTDVTKPVPNVASLPVLTGECSVTVTTIPTATDNCVGNVVGTTTDALTYNSQGTYTITWSYNDGRGNIQTQTQTVIVHDVTPPAIVCAPDQSVVNTAGQCSAQVVVVTPTVSDNCAGYGGNNALNFDGTNDYVSIGNQLAANSSYTKEAWLFNKAPVGAGNIITGNDHPFWLENNLLAASNSFEHGGQVLRDPNQFPIQQWTHVAVTYDAPTSTMKLYRNGIVVATSITTTGYLSGNINIGQYAGGNFINSVIDEVRVWNVARTSAEITANMNVALTGSPAGLVSRYGFDQGTAGGNNTSPIVNSLTNTQGNAAFNGTVTNFALNGTNSNWVNGAPALSGLVLNNSFNNTANASGLYPVGSTNVVWTATDAAGNVSTCTQVITVTAPDINLTGNSVTIARGDVTPSASDNTDFGGTFPSVPVVKTFTIQNTGTSPLTVSSIGISGVNAANFTLSGITFPRVIAANSSTTFNVTFNATAVGVKTATVTVNSNDCDEASYAFAISAEITCTIPVFANTNAHLSSFAAANSCNAVVNYGLSVSGIPAPSLTYTFTGATNAGGTGTGSGQTFNKGVTNVTVSATNSCGTVVNTFDVTVIDNIAPIVTAPQAISVTNDAGKCGARVIITAPSAIDNCGIATIVGVRSDELSLTADYPAGVTTIVWTVTDNSGLFTIVSQTVTVTDNERPVPVITTLPTITSECAANITAPSARDNCSGILTGTTNAPLIYTQQGTYTITWTYTDASNNSFVQTQTVVIDDVTAPVADITTLPTITGECSATVTAPRATDNCVGTVTATTGDPLSYSVQGTYTITWTYNDGNGNTSTQTQTVIVKDVTRPVVNIAVLPTVTGECTATVTEVPTATDNCSGTITGTTTDPLTYTAQGTYTITWRFNDGNGNITAQTQTVIVKDITAPEITCNAAITHTADAGTCGYSFTPSTPAATDNCSATVTGVRSDNLALNAPYPVGITTIVWTATDIANNTATCTQTIRVTDDQFPVLSGVPSNITVECNAVPAAATVTATDNCSTSVVAYNEVRTDGDCPGRYTLTRTWSTTDASGNTTTATQLITVQDTQVPVLSDAPENVTVECNAVPVAAILTATDNCSTRVVTYNEVRTDGNCSGNYILTRTWTAKDACGNTSSKTQVITVQDTQVPVLSDVPADVTVECNAVPTAVILTATDNCSTPVVTYNEVRTDGNCSGNYILTRTWIATDACNNTSNKTQVITVQDTQVPVLSDVPADVTVECNAVPVAAILTATDNCSTPVVTYSEVRTDGNCSGNYILTRTWTATDACNNTSSKTQVITVQDTQVPVLSDAPENVTVECNAVPVAAILTATDNCSTPVVTYSEVRTDGNCSGNYILTRTWTATDACNNTSSKTQVITVQDTQVPVLSDAPENVTVECNAVPVAAILTATDNCSAPVVTYSEVRTDGNCSGNYTLARTWTATDACGNTSSKTQVITVQDTQVPVLSDAPENVTVECNAVPVAAILTVTDNCSAPVVTYSEVRTDGNCSGNYTLTRTWTATDACGNTSSKTQVITVQDTQVPVLSDAPENVTVECNAVPVAAILTATDNCSTPVVTYSEVRIDGNCSGNYILTRTWTATDACGNTSSKTQVITVQDTQVPVLSDAPENVTVECNAVPVAAILTATDNCSTPVVTYSEVRTDGNCSGNYILTRTWTATDACGNTSSKTQVITVQDTQKPVLSAAPANVTVECNAVPAAAILTATDNCSTPIVTYNEVRTDGNCSGNYILTRTWTATDACGNNCSKTQVITVQDTQKPVLSAAPANVTVECNAVPAAAILTATDNCSTPVVTYSEVRTDGNCSGNYTLTRTWTATDACGNNCSKTQVITVQDTQKPVLSAAPANITVECNAVPAAAILTATDNCSTPVVTYNEVRTNGSSQYNYTLTRIWTATDACGNNCSKTQIIIVRDTQAPVPTIASLATLTGDCLVVVTAPTAMDNCAGIITAATVNPTSYTAQGVYTITWNYNDGNGNTSTQTQRVVVKDVSAPIPTVAVLPIVTGQCAATVTTKPTATDACSGVTAAGTTTDPLTYTVQGEYTIHWTYTDYLGNKSYQNQTVIVKDNIAPVPNVVSLPVIEGQCSVNITMVNSTRCTDNCFCCRNVCHCRSNDCHCRGWAEWVYNVLSYFLGGAFDNNHGCDHDDDVDDINNLKMQAPTATDNCKGTIIGTTTDPLTYNTQGTYTIHWSFTDGNGNTSIQNQTVVVADVEAPVPNAHSLPTVYGTCSATVTAKPTAKDNCKGTITGTTTDPLTYTADGTYVIHWIFNDGNGNITTQNQTVIINDDTKPVINEPNDITISCGSSTLPAVTGNATATDNCSGVTITYTDAVNGNKITRTWRATDAAGNYSTDTQVITIADNTKPVITDVADITVNCGTSTLPAATGTPTATDNCSTPVITYSDANSNNKITRTWKATDAAGNYITSTQVITIVDNTRPTINVPANVTISCSGSTNPSSTGGSATGTDNCSSVTVSYTDATIGSVITRTWKVTDASGNFITANQTITLLDNTKPVIGDEPDITISCGASTAPASCGGTPNASDNCSTPTVTYSDVTVGNKITRTWTATDAAGNFSTSTQIITIVDNTKPTISDVSDVTVNCNASTLPSATGTATATDACSTPTVSYTDITSGNKITRTWKAVDAAGNYNTSTQTITIGSAFTAAISSDPTGSTYTGGNDNNLYIGYGAQSTVLQVCSLPSAGAPYTYAWSGSYTNKLNNTNTAAPTFTPSTFGYYTFSVTVTNKFGCTSTASISICVTDIRVAGTSGSGAKVYMCHTPSSGKNRTPQTIQVLVSQVASHLGSGSCGSDGNDRLGSCDQSPCNTNVVNAIVGTTITATKEDGETVATSEEELKVTAMPNPSTTYFTLKIESKYETPVNMRVMDGRGRVVDAKSKIGANSTIQIGHNYSSGTYYAELIQGTQRKVVQLIKGRG